MITPSIASDQMRVQQFGLFLIDDAIDHIGDILSKDVLKQFLNILISFLQSPHLELRQCAFYGVGIASLKIGAESFASLFEQTLNSIGKAIELPKTEDDETKPYLTCKENGVASVGKILQMSG